jgi:hypothetical protein
MKKNLANQIARLWNERLAGEYKSTKTYAETLKEVTGDYCVEIRPCGDNSGITFHRHAELADLERAFGVNAYISIGSNNKLYARIF